MSSSVDNKNQDATCYIGGLDENVTDELLWELMLQAGPVVSLNMPKDRVFFVMFLFELLSSLSYGLIFKIADTKAPRIWVCGICYRG